MKPLKPSPRVLLLLGQALSRPLVDVAPTAIQSLARLPLARQHPEDASAHPPVLPWTAFGGPKADASGPRGAPGQRNPFGNRHERRKAGAINRQRAWRER